MEFSKQRYCSGLLFPSPGDLPNPGIKPMSPALAGRFFTTETPEKPTICYICIYIHRGFPDSSVDKESTCNAGDSRSIPGSVRSSGERIGYHSSIFGLPLWLSWLKIHLQCGRPRFNPWIGKIPWKGERLPTLVFGPRESMDSIVRGVAKSQTRLSNYHFYFTFVSDQIRSDQWLSRVRLFATP